jgi:hypothetical protein
MRLESWLTNSKEKFSLYNAEGSEHEFVLAIETEALNTLCWAIDCRLGLPELPETLAHRHSCELLTLVPQICTINDSIFCISVMCVREMHGPAIVPKNIFPKLWKYAMFKLLEIVQHKMLFRKNKVLRIAKHGSKEPQAMNPLLQGP